jgi:hypothetical protein
MRFDKEDLITSAIALFFLLIAFSGLPGLPAKIMWIACAVIVAPFTRFALEKSISKKLAQYRYALIPSILISFVFIGSHFDEKERVNQEEEVTPLIAEAKQFLEEGEINRADSILRFIITGYPIVSRSAEKLRDTIRLASSDTFAMRIIEEMNDFEFDSLKNKTIEINVFEYSVLNDSLLSRLRKNLGHRETYLAEKRAELIRDQFSRVSGYHKNLRWFVKENMKDPSSFEHVETSYSDKGDYLIVKMVYRGKNSFGALVIGSITAKVSLGGQILEIIDQS